MRFIPCYKFRHTEIDALTEPARPHCSPHQGHHWNAIHKPSRLVVWHYRESVERYVDHVVRSQIHFLGWSPMILSVVDRHQPIHTQERRSLAAA